MARGRAWGNALGGWRKQSRKKNGQFGKGGSGKAKKAKRTTKRSTPAKSVSRKTSSKKSSKKWSKKKKAAVAAGVVGVGAVGLAVYNQRAYNNVYKEMHSLGGEYSYTDLGRGMGVTNLRTVSRARINRSREAGHRAMAAAEKGHKIRARMHAATIHRVSLRPQLHDMGFISQNENAVGFYTTEIRGKRMHAKDVYLDEGSRGNKTVISTLSKHTKEIQGQQVKRGRKIVISKFRSEDSERVVRNQAKRLGKENVIVQKRYNVNSDFTKNITASMDAGWRGEDGIQGSMNNLIPLIKSGDYKGEKYLTQRQRASQASRKARIAARKKSEAAARAARRRVGVVI